jgi:hypothetical protein
LALPTTKGIYTAFSLVLIVFSTRWLYLRGKPFQWRQNAVWLSLACVFSELCFFAMLSVIYDFHDCPEPSRSHPYFAAGRMMMGMLIPFLLVIVFGLEECLVRFGNRTKFCLLAILILGMLTLETATVWPAFFNEYNWFHLP